MDYNKKVSDVLSILFEDITNNGLVLIESGEKRISILSPPFKILNYSDQHVLYYHDQFSWEDKELVYNSVLGLLDILSYGYRPCKSVSCNHCNHQIVRGTESYVRQYTSPLVGAKVIRGINYG